MHIAPASSASHLRTGVLCGLGAYISWGLIGTLYFKQLTDVPPLEILAHRVFWSMVVMGAVITFQRRWNHVWAAMKVRRSLLMLSASTLLIAGNWFGYIYTIVTNQMLQASLGYFINPLVNVLLGYLFLHERLRGLQFASLCLAACGVVFMIVAKGEWPLIALYLACSFGTYGLLRKMVHVDSAVGLTVETILLAPIAASIIAFREWGGTGMLVCGTLRHHILLPAAGLMTAIPLLLFTVAARRLRLSTMGFLQYISPSCMFLLAVLMYGEPFAWKDAVSFGLIWVALAIYSVDSAVSARRSARVSQEAVKPG